MDSDLLIWIRNPPDAGRVCAELNDQIWWGLKEAGIGIPFPQRDSQIRSSELPIHQKIENE